MGTEVTAALESNTKPNYTVATTAAGVVAVADGEMVVFVGSTVSAQTTANAGLMKCLGALRDNGWEDPSAGQLAYATYETVTNTLAYGNGLAPTLTENMIAVLRGAGFEVAGRSASTHGRRMFESALEGALKAA